MNQIIFSEHENVKNIKKNNNKFFKFLFYISIILIFCCSSYFLYSSHITSKKEKLSKNLITNFNLERLYTKKENSINFLLNDSTTFSVIGIIQIPKINIEYPILSHINDELLKIAPCRFLGPLPNKEGNLCIAGHNYDDNRFFSNLNKLNIGDSINIYDSNNNLISYRAYDIFEISKSDTTCTSQNTNGRKEITLITCNNFNGNRLIIKATE